MPRLCGVWIGRLVDAVRWFQHSISAHLQLRQVEQSLTAADSVEECWVALCEACRLFGFTAARIRIQGQVVEKQFANLGGDNGWNIRIPLPGGDYINFDRPYDPTVLPTGVAPLLDMISRVMTEKCLASTELVPVSQAPQYSIKVYQRAAGDCRSTLRALHPSRFDAVPALAG